MYSRYFLSNRLSYLDRNLRLSDAKECFCITAEAEGLLINSSYPFSIGTGSVTMEAFGVPLFFKFMVLGVALSCVSSDDTPSVGFEIQHVSTTGVVTTIDTFLMDSGKFVSKPINSVIYDKGQIAIKILSSDGLSDDFAKYRIALYLQSEQILT